jgi:hypothetical protein
LEIRSYIASKIKLDNKFLDEYRGTSYMATWKFQDIIKASWEAFFYFK